MRMKSQFLRGRDLLVGFGASEELRGIDGRVTFRLVEFIEVFAARLELIGEEIRKRHDARVGVVHEPVPTAVPRPPQPRIPML